MNKKEAAQAAANAGRAVEQAIRSHGFDSPQARAAVTVAYNATRSAQAQGCTRADFDAARR
ncbi:hypothetical protein [Streptomyces sp. NPDC004230]